jgi:cobalt-precorrin-5B (C1)-methyltransferase
MILVFGGTTEGRKAAEVLEEGGDAYYYSTKTGEQDITLHHGRHIDGALDNAAMLAFCHEHDIRLIVDAAHPFASRLHQTIAQTSETLNIPVIRYERIYPPREPDITWIDDYSQIPRNINSLLATTGVQSIAKLKPLEAEGIKIHYRILNRESSIASALKQGASQEQLCYYDDPKDIPVEADAILLKESGVSGGFPEKVETARARGMKIIALKKPETPLGFIQVNGPYGLRRAVEKLLPAFYPLHSGLTTGTCATAAAIAATYLLVPRISNLAPRTSTLVPVLLPNGETIMVTVGYGDGYAYCIKEAGDDPDVTDGIEIRATVSAADLHKQSWIEKDVRVSPRESAACFSPRESAACFSPRESAAETITIKGGVGVGHFTLPGFDYPPGEAAINKGPREMIRRNLEPFGIPLTVTISVPQGEEIARRTFNPRLGIEGGISIIGVSGIVKPFSEEAFIDSIRKCMTVAKASGAKRVVINSGAKSERFVKMLYPELPRQAFVEYGNYIGRTLQMASDLGFAHVTLGVMLGKAVKLAEGQVDTHSRKGTMNKDFIQQMLNEVHVHIKGDYTLARELWQQIPAERLQAFASVVIRHCAAHCEPLLPNGRLTILLIDDEGQIYKA